MKILNDLVQYVDGNTSTSGLLTIPLNIFDDDTKLHATIVRNVSITLGAPFEAAGISLGTYAWQAFWQVLTVGTALTEPLLANETVQSLIQHNMEFFEVPETAMYYRNHTEFRIDKIPVPYRSTNAFIELICGVTNIPYHIAIEYQRVLYTESEATKLFL